jgi:hypothetical protein
MSAIGRVRAPESGAEMNIDLSKDEVGLLRDLLEQRREDLRVEIRRTETPSYHEELRKLERALVAIQRRLETAQTGSFVE